jgi:class 3 adenylate cyclase
MTHEVVDRDPIVNRSDGVNRYAAVMSSSVRTLMFSDIEGSTDLLQRAGDQYADLLQRHREIVRAAVRVVGGREHATEGDSFFVSFDSPSDALAAAVQAQRGLEAHEWPTGLRLRVRIGLHLGETADHDGQLIGIAVHHAARVANAAHGGQIVVTDAVQSTARSLPADTSWRKLGVRRLRDAGTVTLFQVEHPELQRSFPELRGIVANRANLPHIATAFVGGEPLLNSLDELMDRGRVVTLTGTGGVGKTRPRSSSAELLTASTMTCSSSIWRDLPVVPAAVAATIPIVGGRYFALCDRRQTSRDCCSSSATANTSWTR